MFYPEDPRLLLWPLSYDIDCQLYRRSEPSAVTAHDDSAWLTETILSRAGYADLSILLSGAFDWATIAP